MTEYLACGTDEYLTIRSDKWMTARELGLDNHDTARGFRKAVQDYNEHFGLDGQITYILSGSKGYRLTDNLDEIRAAIDKEFKVTGHKFSRIHKIKHQMELLRIDQMSLEDL